MTLQDLLRESGISMARILAVDPDDDGLSAMLVFMMSDEQIADLVEELIWLITDEDGRVLSIGDLARALKILPEGPGLVERIQTEDLADALEWIYVAERDIFVGDDERNFEEIFVLMPDEVKFEFFKRLGDDDTRLDVMLNLVWGNYIAGLIDDDETDEGCAFLSEEMFRYMLWGCGPEVQELVQSAITEEYGKEFVIEWPEERHFVAAKYVG